MTDAAPRERLNGNGNGNGHAAPSVSTLQAEIAGINRSLKDLGAERESLALAAVRNEAAAVARVGAIDAKRVALGRRLETLEAAVRQLHAEEREGANWRKHLPHLRRCFRAEIMQAWERWPRRLSQLLLARQAHDIAALALALAELEALEATTARALADRLLPEVRVPYEANDQDALVRAKAEKAKLVERRRRHVESAAQELLADTDGLRRPAALEQALVDARHRLRVEAVNGRVPQQRPRVAGVHDMAIIGRARG